MIHSASAGVKAPARIPFAFRAYPTALDGLRLPRSARDVFTLLLDNARSRGWRSRLTNAAMAGVLGCTTMTIKRALAALEAAGLILREFVAGGRIRTGVVVTWDGVKHSRSTVQASVEQPRSTGGTSVFRGVEHPGSTNQSLPQSGDQRGSFLPPGEEPGEVPDGPTAARYLKALIAAGRKGGCTVPPPPAKGVSTGHAPAPDFAHVRKAEVPVAARDRVIKIDNSMPGQPQDDVRREVERMAGSVFIDARRAAWGPSPGRRRMTPAEIQRQLAIVRAKYAGRGPARHSCAAARPEGSHPR